MTLPFTPSVYRSCALKSAVAYRQLGWNPLPSHRYRKSPIGCWAEYMDTPVEDAVFANWPDTPNVQLLCGVRWDLAVIDLDGSSAVAAWSALTLHRPNPATWLVQTGSGNWHLYYRVPTEVSDLPSRLIWDGGERHERIDLLGDRSLVVAPPSLHVRTGQPYQFVVGPFDLSQPAVMPLWMTTLGDVRREEPVVPIPAQTPEPTGSGTYDRRSVLAAIRDKVSLVKSWGLRVLGRRFRSGWLECRAIGRADREASAGFHPRSGYYSEPPRYRLSLFDIAVRLGVYPTWTDAVNGLGSRYVRS